MYRGRSSARAEHLCAVLGEAARGSWLGGVEQIGASQEEKFDVALLGAVRGSS